MVYSYSTKETKHLIPIVLRDDMCKNSYKEDGKYLNLGCGKEYYNGWVNLDGDSGIKADVHYDIDDKNLLLPFDDNTFDLIWAAHILEHIWHLRPLKDEMCRILKPGGELALIVPSYQFDDAWGDDTHCRAFSEGSFIITFWPGYEMGRAGHIPLESQPNLAGDMMNGKYWLWAIKPKSA